MKISELIFASFFVIFFKLAEFAHQIPPFVYIPIVKLPITDIFEWKSPFLSAKTEYFSKFVAERDNFSNYLNDLTCETEPPI